MISILLKNILKIIRSQTTISRLLKLIHSNVCTIFCIVANNGPQYFFIFINNYCKYIVIFFIKTKNKVLHEFQKFKA